MTDPVHIHAGRLLDYLDGDANGPGEHVLAHRPYLAKIVADLRAALAAADVPLPAWSLDGVQVSSGGLAGPGAPSMANPRVRRWPNGRITLDPG